MPTLITLLPLLYGGASATPSVLAEDIHGLLDAPSGWVFVEKDKTTGVQVYRKPIASLGLTAWKATKTLHPKVTPGAFVAVVKDLEGRDDRDAKLLVSDIVAQDGPHTTYVQVYDSPGPMANRYWICRAVDHHDPAAGAGHWKRRWSSPPPTALGDLRASLRAAHPRAVEVAITHGSWELGPQADGSTLVTYISVADPGGSVPKGVMSMVTGRNLPDHITRIEAEAQGR